MCWSLIQSAGCDGLIWLCQTVGVCSGTRCSGCLGNPEAWSFCMYIATNKFHTHIRVSQTLSLLSPHREGEVYCPLCYIPIKPLCLTARVCVCLVCVCVSTSTDTIEGTILTSYPILPHVFECGVAKVISHVIPKHTVTLSLAMSNITPLPFGFL